MKGDDLNPAKVRVIKLEANDGDPSSPSVKHIMTHKTTVVKKSFGVFWLQRKRFIQRFG